MWILSIIIRRSRTERITNGEVMRKAGVGRELKKEIRKRQLYALGHRLRADGWERECLSRKIEESRARGKQSIKNMDA